MTIHRAADWNGADVGMRKCVRNVTVQIDLRVSQGTLSVNRADRWETQGSQAEISLIFKHTFLLYRKMPPIKQNPPENTP